MHEQEGTIQLSAAAKCPNMNILLQQIAESYLVIVTDASFDLEGLRRLEVSMKLV